jgi:hypothetical protein
VSATTVCLIWGGFCQDGQSGMVGSLTVKAKAGPAV